MANAWDEYKKKHGISDQPAQQAETENAWERYKRETGIESGTDIWQKKVQNRAEATKRNREAQTQERRNLYAQKREIDNFTGPQPIGGEDAMKANYYYNLSQYGAKYGDAAAQDEGFRNYRQAMANVDKAYSSELEKNRRQDAAYDTFRQAAERIMPFQSELSRAGRELTVQDQRYTRDANLYNQMGQAANQTGSKALWDKAEKGYEQATDEYNKAYSQTAGWIKANTDKYTEGVNAFLAADNEPGETIGYENSEDLQTNAEAVRLKSGTMALADRGKAAYERDKSNGVNRRGHGGISGKFGKEISAEDVLNAYEKARTSGTAKTYDERGPEDGMLSEWQKTIFYALYAENPQYAWEWMAAAQEQAENQYYAELADEFYSGMNRVPGMLLSAGAGLMSGISPYSEFGQTMSKTAEAITSGGARAISEKGILNTGLLSGKISDNVPVLGGKGLGDLYQLGVSMVQSGALAAAGAAAGDYNTTVGTVVEFLGTALMGGGAAASDYRESLSRGMTKMQAMQHATAAGIAEAAFEYISLDKLVKMDISKGFWKNVLKQGGVEASEEFCTTLANRFSDAMLARTQGYDNQIEYRTKELIALGMSREEAEHKAETEWVYDIINDALGGFISGGLMSAGSTLTQWNEYKAAMEQRGAVTSAEEATALRSFAEANGIKVGERVANATDVTEGAEREALAPTTENGTENQPTTEQSAKLSRREIRQERRANRETGELESEVAKKLSETVHERGLNNAQAIFDEQTQQHGAAITRVVQQAIVNEARTVFAQAQNQSELTKAYQQAVETATAKPVKQALKQAYQDATTLRAYQGDKEAMTDALIGGGSGRALDLSAELTAADGSTQQVQIKALNTKQGEIVLDNGSTVTLDELQGLDADTKDIIQRLDAFELGEARPLAFLAYQTAVEKGEVTDGTRWVMSWALAFDQGRNGAISMQEAIKRSSMPADVVRKAYELGAEQTETWRRQKEAENAEKRKKAEDGATGRKGILDSSRVSQENLDSLSADKKDTLLTLELIAEATGVDIRLIAQKVTKRGNVKGYQGLYNKDGNYIEIDINAGINNIFEDLNTGMTAVLGHEMTHWMQENAPTEYLAYKKAVLQAIMSTKNGELTLERMIEAQIKQNKRAGNEITRSQAEDEVVADASMKRMGDTEFWDAVSENLGDKKADVFTKIKEYISQFFNRVREIIGKASHTSEAAKLIDRVEADVQATLRRLYAEGIGAAMRNSAQTATETKNAAMQTAPSVKTSNKSNELFSMRSPVEQTDRLIAWHNMSEEALRSALELGGLAMPSWAIKTADKAHTSYGDISVIAPRSLVDPKMNRNSMIFGGDAWTPVFPDVNYKISSEAVDALTDEIEGLIGKDALRDLGGAALDETNIADQFSKHGGAVSNYYKRNQALRYAYLKSIGQDIELPKTAKRLDDSGKYENDAVENFVSRLVYGKKSLDYYRSMTGKEIMQEQDLKKAITDTMVTMYGEEVRDAYAPEELSFRDIEAMLYAANKYFTEGIREEIDSRAVGKAIDKVIDEAAYEKWIGDKLSATIERKGIRNNKDLFTPSGKRRSFDELNYAYNLANIVKAMKAQPKQGRTQFLSGPGSVKGAALKNYSTVEQVRADRSRLVNTAEEGKAAYDAYNDNLADILDRMSKTGDRFDTADALIEILQHAKTEDAIYRYMERELKDWYNVSRELAHDIYKLIGQINELPMEYFEGKTYDAVSFNETAAVVVPDTISADLKQQLIDAGANVIEYKAGDNEDRLAKVNSAENVQFSTRDYSDVSDLDLLLNAADEISEGGGEEYWASLLKEEPGLANETAEIKRLGKQLKKTEADLAEARRNLTLTDRKLKTRGIASLAATIMRDQKAGDINKKDVKNRITAVLTDAYQKALDQLDAGADVGTAWETVYSEGVVKASDILLTDATYAEKLGYKWYKNTLGAYLGEGAREYVEADIGARVAEDFQANRYRPGQKGTVADRLVAQAENRVNKKLTAAKTENAALKDENAKLSEDKAFFKEQAETAAKTAKDLYEQLVEKREELKNNKKIGADERKATLKRLDNLERQMKAKRREAEVWKSKAETGWKVASQAIRERDAAVDKLEKQLQRERDILAGKLKPPAIQKMLAAAREREGKRIAEMKDERFAAYKEKQSAAQLRSRIKNLSDEMKRKMTKPTDGSYVPASLYGAMTQVADLLDKALAPKAGTKAEAKYRAMMDAIHSLANEYNKVAEMDDYTYKSEFDAEIMDEIKELEEVLTKDQSWVMAASNDNRALREYSLGDLTRIYEILRTINEAMTSASHFLGKANFQSIWDAMGQIAEQQGDMTSFNRLGWYGKKKRMRMLDSLNVMRAVEMMSNWDRSAALYRIMQQVENGVDVSNAWMMEYNKAMQSLKTGKNEKAYRDALTKKLDYSVTDEEGLPVLMTKMQALQILMTAEREAHNDKLVHLQRGGATIRDALAIQDGKKDAASQTIKVTPELIQRIQNSLTEWDKAYMKAIRDYFGKEGKATNRVLYALKHRVLQTEDYYVPYAVDKNYLDTDLNETQAMNMWVKTPGSTNALQKKASQPVIIDGMDTVMAKHVREIADYIGLAIPIRDFAKVYNGRLKQGEGENPLPVKQTIDKNWKAKGQHLLTQSIIDVQGGSRGASWSTAIAEHLNALQSAFVKSALLVNPSVTIKQAASYAAAGSILSHAALDRANHPVSVKTDESNAFDPATGLIGHIFFAPNGATAMRIYNEIDKHTSLHYQRRLGMSQAELANEANRSGKLKRAMNNVGASMEQTAAGHIARKVGASLNPVSWIQRMDVATTATLWLACKEQARMDGMKVGTEEYWQHVTELYERVIRETQPMYDSLHRNAGQKNRENSLMQYLFPFRTVPIQNHGQIAASYETLQTALKSKDEARIKEAKKFFAKTMWAQTESAVIFSLMSFIAAALKRKTKKYRDEDEEISLESVLRGIGSDTAGTMFSNFFPLFGSAIWDSAGNIYDSVKTGKKVWSYDAYSVGVVDLMNEFAKAGESLVTDVANMIAGKDVGWDKLRGDILDTLVKSMKCIGIPASTIKTYTEGFAGNLQDLKEGRIPALNDASWERSAAVNANRYLKAWIADDDAKVETVKAEMMGNYTEAGKDEEEANKALKTKLTATAKDAFSAGTLDMTDAILFLVDTGYYDEDDAWNKVRQWAAENEHEGDEEYKWNQYEDLRAAFDAGTGIEEAIKELEDHGYSETQLANEISDNIRGALTAGAISEETAIDYMKRYRGMDEDKAWKKVQEWQAKAEHADEEDYSYSQYDAIDAAIDANKDIKDLVPELTAHGVKAESITSHVKQHLVENYVNGSVSETALRNQLSRYCGIVAKDDVDKIVNDAKCRKDTGYAYSALDEAYRSGEVSKTTMKNALMKYGGKTSAEADKKLRWWDLQVSKPSLEISESAANAWYDGTTKTRENGHESANAAGMSIEAYLKAKAVLDEIKDANDNGSGEDEVIAELAKMNLTARQKDALYYERYKGTTKISKTKSW